jgi:hypothetical protein
VKESLRGLARTDPAAHRVAAERLRQAMEAGSA